MESYLQTMFGNQDGYSNIVHMPKNADYIISDYHQSNLLTDSHLQKYTYNTYVTLNTFRIKKRRTCNLHTLSALFVDIDCYTKKLSKDHVLQMLNDDYFGKKIPTPTYVIDSGRGIYLIWKLDGEHPKALKRWKATQKYICKQLQEFGADYNALDAARFLRVPGSINPKSNTAVSIMQYSKVSYTLYSVMEEYMPVYKKFGGATDKQIKFARSIATKKGIKEPNYESFKATKRWIKKHATPKKETYLVQCNQSQIDRAVIICQDLQKLYSMRNRPNCKREVACFIYWSLQQQILCWDQNKAADATLAFNATFSHPHPEKYILGRCKPRTKYKFKTQTILAMLEITDVEQQSMVLLRAPKTNKQKCKDYYERKLEKSGKKRKSEEKKEQKEAMIYGYQHEGFDRLTVVAICNRLQISRSTFYRLKKALETDGISFVALEQDVIVVQAYSSASEVGAVEIVPSKPISPQKSGKAPKNKGETKKKSVSKNHTPNYIEELCSSKHPTLSSVYIQFGSVREGACVYKVAAPLGITKDMIQQLGVALTGVVHSNWILSGYDLSRPYSYSSG